MYFLFIYPHFLEYFFLQYNPVLLAKGTTMLAFSTTVHSCLLNHCYDFCIQITNTFVINYSFYCDSTCCSFYCYRKECFCCLIDVAMELCINMTFILSLFKILLGLISILLCKSMWICKI